jgi:TonB family protein
MQADRVSIDHDPRSLQMEIIRNAAHHLRRYAVALAMACAATTAPLQAADDPVVPMHAVVDVELDAAGRVLAVEPADPVAREIAGFLREQVLRWQFEPATLRGEPVPTRTSVTVRLEATGARSGRQVEVRIIDAATGPRYKMNRAPRYPLAAIDRKDSGEVLLRVDFDRDGRVTDIAVERRVGREYFEHAALAAVREWTFEPERAGDVGIPARVLVPIRFCIQGKPCKSLPEKAEGVDPSGPQLVGEPAARIVRRGAAG